MVRAAPSGTRLIDSTPPATTMSYCPAMTPCAACSSAAWLDPQARFTVIPGTVSGKPAASAAYRPMLLDWSPIWLTHPHTTSSMITGSIPVRSTSAVSTSADRSCGCIPASEPLRLPIGVRTASTMTASGMTGPLSVRSTARVPRWIWLRLVLRWRFERRVGEDRVSLLQPGPYRLTLVRAGGDPGHGRSLGRQPVTEGHPPGAGHQCLRGAHRLRVVPGDLPGELQRGGPGVVGGAGGQADPGGLRTGDHPTGQGQLHGHVHPEQAGQDLGAGHVRDESPAHLGDAQRGIGRDDPDVRAERQLQPAAERGAGHGRDHRRGQAGPDAGRALATAQFPQLVVRVEL